MAEIQLENLTKVYPDGTQAVSSMNLEVADGEFVVFVGPSGCGKTTALRMVAGLETITDGSVRIAGEVVNDLPPKDRDVAMVFQNYALYPHMSAHDNMGFALKMRGVPKGEIARRVGDAAAILGLTDSLRKKPRTLSGGQRQRVAMGRAIVREPRAFLMDEPLSNLDAKLRVQMRAEISKIQGELGTTTIYVTHDQVEAMTMGDRVAVMRKGELQQVAAPQDLYDQPVNLFVGGFIGSPAMNLLEATLERSNGNVVAKAGGQTLHLQNEVLQTRPALEGFVGRQVILGIRPEDLEDASLAPDRATEECMKGQVVLREALGAEIMVHFTTDARPAQTDDVRELVQDLGDERAIEEASQERGESTLVGRFSPETKIREGETAAVAVDTRRMHFFDPETGLAIYDGDSQA